MKGVPSNHDKYEEEALKLYKKEVKDDLKFLSRWVYFKENPKWLDYLRIYSIRCREKFLQCKF
jgi:hypothetical protein